MSHTRQLQDYSLSGIGSVVGESCEIVIPTPSRALRNPIVKSEPSVATVPVRKRLAIPKARRKYLRRKYKIERLIGCGLLVPAAPVILGICLIVKLTSRGPGLYSQVRVGLNGRKYEILKIRTMRTDAESDGVARWCVKNDPRITRLGSFLRKVHLDELPQLINVAKGEMVLVGPRPERPAICEKLANEIDRYYDRVQVKPGITGLSQINLPPDETLDDARRKQMLDLQYIAEANAWLDLRMIAVTLLRMFGVRGDRVNHLMRLCRKSILADLEVVKNPEPKDSDDKFCDRKRADSNNGSQAFQRPSNPPRKPR
jgi:lipopolysaccharide/colanic/teichoic acid biosynthesis glycosyltransferase